MYKSIVNDYIEKGYVIEVIKSEMNINCVWYLFYYFVINEYKFGKVCVVFDCVVIY